MNPPSRSEREAARITREIARRAIRRLDVLEWVFLAGAAGLAIGGGALLALLISDPIGIPFRHAWMTASLLFFVIPGAIALTKIRREGPEETRGVRPPGADDDG